MLLTIHRSHRLLYSLPPAHRLVYQADVWSFAASDRTACVDARFSDTRTASNEVLVHAPFGSEIIAAQLPVDWPEFRLRLRVYWDPSGLLAEQVYRLACQGVRGFRLAAGEAEPAAVTTARPEDVEALVISGDEDEVFALEMVKTSRGRRRR
jgi:hypothetical protein